MATVEREEMNEQRVVRITDIAQEPLETLLPIEGFEEMPLVSLEEAVKELVHILPRIQTYAHVAKERCTKPIDNLTQDEAASIMLYTMGWKPLDKCLYNVLNATLRSKDREQLTSWFLYLRLLFNALARLPSISRTVFRGVKLNLIEKYTKTDAIIWWGFSSCTIAMSVLRSELFLGRKNIRTLFTIECLNGKDICKHSYYKSEDEILLLPGTQFKIVDTLDQGDLKLIHLQEIIPRFPYLPSIPTASPEERVIIPSASLIDNNTKWTPSGCTVAGASGEGSQLDQLSHPQGIYVDDDDEQCIYIADSSNHRIVRWKTDANMGEVVVGGNGKENRKNQLNEPTDVILDKDMDSFIICNRGTRRVVRRPCRSSIKGRTIISDIDCWGLAMDINGDLYVSDTKKNEVKLWKIGEKRGTIVAGGNGKGDKLNQLNGPNYLFVDQDQSVYVSDYYNHRVMKWMKGAKEGIVVAGGQGQGDSLTQLSYPLGVIVDRLGNIYVADSSNHRIMCWSKESKQGRVIVGGNGEGQQSNQLFSPQGLSFDRQHHLYVVDYWNHRVQKFDIDSN